MNRIGNSDFFQKYLFFIKNIGKIIKKYFNKKKVILEQKITLKQCNNLNIKQRSIAIS
jgi:hypothetical protein